MEARIPRSEVHVAQRSRRDKLRVAGHHLEEFPSNLEQRMLNSGLMLTSDPDDSPASSNAQLIHRDAMLHQLAAGVSSSNHLAISEDLFKLYGDAHDFDGLRRQTPNFSTNWAVYNSNGSTNQNNQNPVVVREVLSADLKVINGISGSEHHLINNAAERSYCDLSSKMCSQDSEKHHGNGDDFPSKIYSDTLQEVISSVAGASNLNTGNELALLPAYRREMHALGCNDMVSWNNNMSDGSYHGGTKDTNAQGLSLTLSSIPSSSMLMIQNNQDAEAINLEYPSAVAKSSLVNKKHGKALHEITGVSTYNSQWSTGPLGPFTGYATILKSSQFLKPAQDLLDELCGVSSPKSVEIYAILKRISGENYMSTGDGGKSNSSTNMPLEDQQRRAALLIMQDEICRRYKQYYQQMQMVVSSFEPVAGLSAATPYISLALKTIARNFRCLKNAILDQLRNVKSSSGNDLSPPDNGAINSLPSSNFTLANQIFAKSRPFVTNMSFLDAHHHVWRPQRGLPEQSVAILRAWLFEHFLHPYPTDTDKHMLATQTGLSRNQVSNWFINARVRLWKPMVEEIHALETKRLAEGNPNAAPSGETPSMVSSRKEATDHRPFRSSRHDHQMASTVAKEQTQYPEDGIDSGHWNQEPCYQFHGQLPASSDGPLMDFIRFPQGGMQFSRTGPVSLSLGLRHSAQRQDNELRQRFGGDAMQDLVD
ncbi:hypothetical protein SAY86_022373 [Trapa natans]|uniref:Homeobox domain-containing protein n=1 Tax=Trapa natans TaxID=22666 RepID=A0AAN7LNA2_TRANT|nr:hypothetical protein SAY86_022373 [Trapa natans]